MEETLVKNPPVKQDIEINEWVDGVFDFISSLIGNLASNIAPLGAGIMPSYLTFIHATDPLMLNFPGWVGFCAAAVIEFMGLGAGQEAMTVWNQRRQHKEEKEKMPMWAPMTSVIWYVAIMIMFNVLLEIKITNQSYLWVKELIKIVSTALFATLAIPAYMLVAAKQLRKEWEMKEAKDKAQAREDRRKAKEERRQDELARQEREKAETSNSDSSNLRKQVADFLIWKGWFPSKIKAAQLAVEMELEIQKSDPEFKFSQTEKDNMRKYIGQFRTLEEAGQWAIQAEV